MGSTHHELPRLIRVLSFEASYITLKKELLGLALLLQIDETETDCKRVEIRMTRHPCKLVRQE